MKRMDKKGQQMTLGTIIAIVLGIAVLVFLIFGFSTGWSSMWDRVINYGGGSSNVDTIKQSCSSFCDSKSNYGFCDEPRTLKFKDADGKAQQVSLTCDKYVNTPINIAEGSDVTAEQAKLIDDMNFEKCPTIDCTA